MGNVWRACSTANANRGTSTIFLVTVAATLSVPRGFFAGLMDEDVWKTRLLHTNNGVRRMTIAGYLRFIRFLRVLRSVLLQTFPDPFQVTRVGCVALSTGFLLNYMEKRNRRQ
jgi:hypothetical protein